MTEYEITFFHIKTRETRTTTVEADNADDARWIGEQLEMPMEQVDDVKEATPKNKTTTDMTPQEAIKEIEEIKARIHKADRVYRTFEDYAAAPELVTEFAGCAPSELQRHLKVAARRTFLVAFGYDVDPLTGKGPAVYRHYIADGIRMLKKTTSYSVLSTAPLRFVYIFNAHDDAGFIIDGDRPTIPKTDANRKMLQKLDHITVI